MDTIQHKFREAAGELLQSDSPFDQQYGEKLADWASEELPNVPDDQFSDVVEKKAIEVSARRENSQIKAEKRGRIKRILLDNATPVEFGQPLMELE